MFRLPLSLDLVLLVGLALPAAAQQLTFNFGPGVTDADKALISSAGNEANHFFRSQFGVAVAAATFDVTNAVGANGVQAFATPGRITINTRTVGWVDIATAMKYKIVVHEMFHLLQYQFGDPLRSETWLTEGSAEYVGYRAADAAGQFGFGLARSLAIDRARPVLIPLSQLRATDSGAYSVGFVAVDQLVGQYGLGSLAEFYRLGGTGSAFQTVFGRSLAQFYSEYEGLRSSVLALPPAAMSAVFMLPLDYNPTPNYLQFAFKLTGVSVQQARSCQCPPQSFVGNDANYDLILFLHNSNPPGRYTFTWQNPGGVTLAGTVDKPSVSSPNPVPAITSLSRTSAVVGEAGFNVVISGSGYARGVTASWNNSARPTIVLSQTQLQMGLSALDFAGPGTAQIRVANATPGGGVSSALAFTVTARADRPSVASPRSVGNAATYVSGQVSPGEIISIFGSNLGPDVIAGLRLDAQGKVSTALSGTRVLFDSVPSPLIFVRADQVSAIVPYSVARSPVDGSTTFQIERNGTRSEPMQLSVVATVPGLFTANSSGSGPLAALNQDGSVNSAINPAAKGSIVVLFGTGEGETDPAGVDGQVASTTFPKPKLPLSVRIGGVTAEVVYAGAAPSLVAGVLQVNVKVPESLIASGDLPVALSIGSGTNPQGATVWVK